MGMPAGPIDFSFRGSHIARTERCPRPAVADNRLIERQRCHLDAARHTEPRRSEDRQITQMSFPHTPIDFDSCPK